MADTKISAFTAVTPPLTGAETVPLVVGSANRRTTAQDIANLSGVSGDGLTIWRGTEAAYDAIATKDPDTLYLRTA